MSSKFEQYQYKLNAIKRFWSNPCDAPFVVYLETAFAMSMRTLFQLVSFGMGDVMRGALKPKGIGGKRAPHMRRKKGKGAGLPEFGNEMGNAMGRAAGIKDRQMHDGVKHLWVVDDHLQRVLFWWMIIDLGVSFFFGWQSMIHREGYCEKRLKTKAALASGDDWVLSSLVDQPLGNGAVRYTRAVAMSPNGVCSVGAGRWTCVTGFTAEPVKGGATPAIRWYSYINTLAGGSSPVSSFDPANPTFGKTGPVSSFSVTGPDTFTPYFGCDGGFADVHHAYVLVLGEEEALTPSHVQI